MGSSSRVDCRQLLGVLRRALGVLAEAASSVGGLLVHATAPAPGSQAGRLLLRGVRVFGVFGGIGGVLGAFRGAAVVGVGGVHPAGEVEGGGGALADVGGDALVGQDGGDGSDEVAVGVGALGDDGDRVAVWA